MVRMSKPRLYSFASIRKRKDREDKVGSQCWAVTKDNIVEGTINRLTNKSIFIGEKYYPFCDVYLDLSSAEDRFVREAMGYIESTHYNLGRMIEILERLKEERPSLFI